ncbi:VOC family protein [Bifidobacterium tibiigranuli]|jgi:catechol 2,3-dioxygenase-like lactoylglutathione lyase family enzyme|uniref:VOC family protein n=1 Tax=Bifidobacterium tibiigranuli TaxID=2172043 RepID=UPI002353129D|nr:VOC family protein [Bifidobacterium tibiigranuli]MCI1210573.1 VOC family protein [Bifidobacterium tibiigranuli]MCI1222031.1 VOC family protein [Bifidobacterium tibiigranuli]MCI1233066.1 VOC family protein [Bifidobacterium tibiigranuli]
MIDHMTLHVRDVERSIAFYTAALAPLGYVVKTHHEPTLGFGVDDGTPHSDFYVSPLDEGAANSVPNNAANDAANGTAEQPHGQSSQQPYAPTHIAFLAPDRAAVQAFYDAALAAGGHDNGTPGPRPYHAGYYAAFVLDPDGNNIEAVVDWSHDAGFAVPIKTAQ